MLLHGQAAVERGSSVNSKLLVENLQKKTLVVSRFVYSSVKSDANHFSELSFTSVEDEICEVKCKRKLLNKNIPSHEPRSRQISFRGGSESDKLASN